jgi:type I restriction enzyme S subunit
MFGDPVNNSKKLKRMRLGDVAKVVTGNTPSRKRPEYYGDYIEWIKSDNLNNSMYYATRADESLSELGLSVGRSAPANSILITCIAGSPACIGNSAMVDREVAFNQQINALVDPSVNPHFLYAQTIVGKTLIQQASTNGMKGIVSKGRLEEVLFIVPPDSEQDTFAKRSRAIEQLKETCSKDIRSLDALFDSLQHRAFRGEL